MSTTQATPDIATASADRAARLAVTVFPILVIVAGVIGFLLPGTVAPLGQAVPWLLGVVMFGMGLTLTLPDFSRILKRPWMVAIGVVLQYLIMPLTAWLIALALQLPAELAAGVILVGCAPGGTASNVVTYLSRGDTALSVTVTTCSTLLAPVLTPLLTLWLAGQFLEVPFASMMMSILQTVLLPVVAGLIVRLLLRRWVERVQPALPWLSTVAIALIVAAVVAGSADKIVEAGLLVFLAVFLHNGFGLLLGYLAAWGMRMTQRERRAISIEVGMQNSGLAASLAAAHFSPLAALPAAVFSVWHNLSGAIFALIMGRRPVTDE
ncbi:bile acid:sodium symporter family protein [Microbacterium paludicola]|uniref:Bile acid:sodium symporter family protein n=1 Tax=Microbacterium paludicola TaxID=300019 RepID=A0A4Y9FY58_9MICO|nr:bile acid:sodium symporter family protein [Microbacterium paludicola]MBF0815737.1 bile acid:sodium symporter family protein [Microbacterium paludicola]TFU33575.1 bile acid:sodium symporter family protein [Microbacterium paludicola]